MTNNIVLPDNHYFKQVSGDLDALIAPLKPFGSLYISFMRYYNDGSQIYLSSIPGWVSDYYSENLYGQFISRNTNDYQTGSIFWPSQSPLKVFSFAREKYDSDNGFTFVISRSGYTDYYFLSGSRNNTKLINFYINHKHVLNQFFTYFEDRAESLIAKAEKHKVQLVKHAPNTVASNQELTAYGSKDIQKAMRSMRVTKYRLKDNDYQHKKLSSREIECILGYHSRLTAEETSINMNVKRRTVEHYFENIKNKLHANTKEEVIAKLIEDGFPLLLK